MSEKHPLLTLDLIKALKLYPINFALAALVFTIFWADYTGKQLNSEEIVVRLIAGIGLAVNFGISLWELYSESTKSQIKKKREKEVEESLSKLLADSEPTTSALNDITAKIDLLRAELEATNRQLKAVQAAVKVPSAP